MRAAVREAGTASLSEVKAMVLELDGSFAVVTASDSGNASALADVAGVPDTDHSRNRA